MPDLADRLSGAVWGHLIGDAMGVPYEFAPASAIQRVEWGHRGSHNQPPGTWSDDGALMLALLDSLLTAGLDLDDQGRRALTWLSGRGYAPGPLFDIGNTTNAALQRLKHGVPAVEAGGAAENDNGNGSLMRILPVALVYRDYAEDTMVEHAMICSSLTHRHPRSQVACAAYCLVASALLKGDEPQQALNNAFASLRRTAGGPNVPELDALERFTRRTGSGYVLDTFWSAWSAFSDSRSYPETIERAIHFGGDTDTTAAVAGGLAGICWGWSGIPAQWLSGMRGREIVEPLVARLIA
ncbi:MAG: ADP-ribosylglycohydrolase family protein [Actinomycetota bacterium]|nr:ADP-ribosylglycohydrolase family protein [Actinomycetota bacterium]